MWLSDEEYVFRQDIREKKSIGRGSRCKKNGSKSKKCTLPSDYLTRKEKMAMNGDCVTYNFQKLYSYEEFKAFPSDIQVQYLNALIDRYKVSRSAIAEELFRISPNGLYKHLEKLNIVDQINKPPYGNRSALALESKAHFMSAVEKASQPVEEPKNDILEKPPVVEEKPIEAPKQNTKSEPKVYANCHSMNVTMDGFDSSMIDFMRLVFVNKSIKVHITVDVLNEKASE